MTLRILGDKRKSRFDPDLADRVNKRVEEEERRELLEQKLRAAKGIPAEPATPIIEPATPPESIVSGEYQLIKTANYALGIEELRKQSQEPFRFKENLQARLEQPDLYDTWLDSRCGIAYKAGTSNIKIIPDCQQLKDISVNFKAAFLSVPYSSLSGVALDTAQGKWNQPLTPAEIIAHPGWIAAVEGDIDLLQRYVTQTFAAHKAQYPATEKMMSFNVVTAPAEDQLRALYVDNLDYRSVADGSSDLNSSGSFLRRVTPVVR